MILWRISDHVSLIGEGGMRTSRRWHTRGRRIVYCAESPAAALLEILVHLEIASEDLPTNYRLLKIKAPDDLAVERVPLEDLPRDWVESPSVTRVIGDAWLVGLRSALLAVPSAVVPETSNVLINPEQKDASRIVIAKVSEHPFDRRLL